MKTPALVAVDASPEALAPLLAAAAKRRLRVGWLDLAATPEAPPELASVVALGAAKAVSAAAERTLAIKPLHGAPVLRDLLREHFVGYAIVLVRGHEGGPRVQIDEDSFRLELADGRKRKLGADDLLVELLRPRYRA